MHGCYGRGAALLTQFSTLLYLQTSTLSPVQLHLVTAAPEVALLHLSFPQERGGTLTFVPVLLESS